MARIRTIKPEFPQSESMGRVSRESRLCFVLLWTIADDSGRLRGNSRMLASLLYPYDDDAKKHIEGWLSELVNENCIVRYEVDGTSYIQVCNWASHQKIDRPSASKIPPFDESSRILANPREHSSGDQGMDQGMDQGKERKGKEGKGEEISVALRARREQVAAVFDCWRKTMQHPKAVLDDKRRKLIEARMKDGYSADDLCRAIIGCSRSAFHMGMNDRGTRYDGIDLIFRDAQKVDQFLKFEAEPPRPMGKQDMNEAINRMAGDEFLSESDFGGTIIEMEADHAGGR